MKVRIVECQHCGRPFSIEYDNACPDCYPYYESMGDGGETPWIHMYWIEEGNLFVWQEQEQV